MFSWMDMDNGSWWNVCILDGTHWPDPGKQAGLNVHYNIIHGSSNGPHHLYYDKDLLRGQSYFFLGCGRSFITWTVFASVSVCLCVCVCVFNVFVQAQFVVIIVFFSFAGRCPGTHIFRTLPALWLLKPWAPISIPFLTTISMYEERGPCEYLADECRLVHSYFYCSLFFFFF